MKFMVGIALLLVCSSVAAQGFFKDHYFTGTLGAGNESGSSSVAAGFGVGALVGSDHTGAVYMEAGVAHFGTYTHSYTRCTQVRRRCVVDTYDVTTDYARAYFQVKVNAEVGQSWQPFLTIGPAFGEQNDALVGIGVQLGNNRWQYQHMDEVELLTFTRQFR